MGLPIRWWTAGRQADKAFDKTFDDVYDFAMRAMRDPDRAADVVHETMLRIRKDLRARRVPADAKRYALTIAATVIFNELHELLHVAPFAACIAGGQPLPKWTALASRSKDKPDENASRQQVAAATWAELSALDIEQRTLVELHARHGMGAKAIADALKRPKAEVSKRVAKVTGALERRVRARLLQERSSCDALRAALEGVEPPDARAEIVESHAPSCNVCAPEHARAVGALSILKDFALVPATKCVKSEIRKRTKDLVEEWERHHPAIRRWHARGRIAIAVLAAAAMLGGGGALSHLAATDGNEAAPAASSSPSVSPSASASVSVSPTATTSPTVTPVNVPSQPTLTVSLSLPSVTLSWTAAKPNVTSYVVQRAIGAGAFGTIASPSARSFKDASVTAGVTYRYRVAAVNQAGRGPYSKASSITIPAAPGAPRDLAISGAGCDITLKWSPPASEGTAKIQGYNVWRVVDGSELLLTKSGPIDALSFTQTIAEGGSYTFRVRAVNAVGPGPAASTKKILDPCPG